MPFGMSSGIPNVIIHAKFHVDRLRGFWAAGPPKVSFPILIGTTLTTVLHYRADCDNYGADNHRQRTVVRPIQNQQEKWKIRQITQIFMYVASVGASLQIDEI